MRRGRRYVFLGLLGWAASLAGADVKTLSDVPSYLWYHGCGPTAAGMILGYWDAHGFGNLIDGSSDWGGNRPAIEGMIATPGHLRDYVPTPDREATPADPYHADDCVADFMYTSRDPLAYGDSYGWSQPAGMAHYAQHRGYVDATGDYVEFQRGLWEVLVEQIDDLRPVGLFVDSTADGSPDHFVTAVGYDDAPGAERYACYNTYDHSIHWYAYGPAAPGQAYGVRGGTCFDPGVPAGDADLDGAVTLADLSALALHWDTPGGATWGMGDFDDDGAVGLSDLSILASNWQAQVTAPSAVPAPTGLAMLSLSAAAALCRGKR